MTQTAYLKTPLSHPDKVKFISHVNEEHQDELAMFAEAFTDVAMTPLSQVVIDEVFTQGVELIISDSGQAKGQARFVSFSTAITNPDELRAQYINLMQKAAKKLGKKTIKLQEQYFTVQDSYHVTPNMLRLVVTAPPETPLTHPGYAYLFDLTTPTTPATSDGQGKSAGTPSRQQCYYTLRRAWSAPDHQKDKDITGTTGTVISKINGKHNGSYNESHADANGVTAWIDVYLHGDTPGGNWASSLRPDTTIKSLREYPEKIEHLSSGQCLLIADETSLPTVARLLETWQNPIAPVVIVITNDPKDAEYLQHLQWQQTLCRTDISKNAVILPITHSANLNLAEEISERLACYLATANLSIDKVWGALEASDTKALRKRLKASLGLSRQDMVLKVYWRRQ